MNVYGLQSIWLGRILDKFYSGGLWKKISDTVICGDQSVNDSKEEHSSWASVEKNTWNLLSCLLAFVDWPAISKQKTQFLRWPTRQCTKSWDEQSLAIYSCCWHLSHTDTILFGVFVFKLGCICHKELNVNVFTFVCILSLRTALDNHIPYHNLNCNMTQPLK